MLLNKENACLVVIDIQEKLAPQVLNHESLIKNCLWLINLARELHVSTIVSEQYPKGLGKTVAELMPAIQDLPCIEKVHFSCLSAPSFKNQSLIEEKQQFVLCGMETSVCVLQTALELTQSGKDVYVVADAVSGRHEFDNQLAIARMRYHGIEIISKEMVFFEWLRKAAGDTFKQLSKAYLK